MKASSFSCVLLHRFLRSQNDIEVFFIEYDAFLYFGPFIEIIVNALKALLSGVVFLFVLIRLMCNHPATTPYY